MIMSLLKRAFKLSLQAQLIQYFGPLEEKVHSLVVDH